jgi:DNA-binding transcriptional MocR family regulator
MAAAAKKKAAEPPKPEQQIVATMQRERMEYTQFADRMIHAVHEKSCYCVEASNKHFEELVSPSQEVFTLLLFENGYMDWVWMKNESGTSDTSNGRSNGASDGPD